MPGGSEPVKGGFLGSSQHVIGDEIAFPVAGYGPVLRLCRAFADHDRQAREKRLTADRLAVRAAAGAPPSAGPGPAPGAASSPTGSGGSIPRLARYWAGQDGEWHGLVWLNPVKPGVGRSKDR